MRYTFRVAAVAAMITTLATAGGAQGVGSGGGAGVGRGTARGGGRGVTTTLGWAGALECIQCTVHISPSGNWVEFGAEPVVRGRTANGGLLLDGDVVVAVDGILITTAAGGRLLSGNSMAGVPTRLTVRRGGRQMEVAMPQHVAWVGDSIRARFADPLHVSVLDRDTLRGGLQRRINGNDTTYYVGSALDRDTLRGALRRTINGNDTTYHVGGAPAVGRGVLTRDSAGRYTYSFGRGSQIDSAGGARDGRGAAGRLTFKTGDIRASDNGWLGFGIECRNCAIKPIDSAGTGREWTIASYPTVMGVSAGGPADVAGLRVGDVLREVDGVSITTFAGAARFSKVKAGDKVRLSVLRDGKPVTVTLTVARAH